jgi:tetratricopeptide (TPR) repeat protein
MHATELQPRSPRLERLIGFLDHDSGNLILLADTAAAAFADNDLDLAAELIERCRAIEPLIPSLENLDGMVALARGDFAKAAKQFDHLLEQDPDSPPLRFNLAWAHAMTGAYEDAFNLLNDATIDASPRGPALKIQMMHHLERFDEALKCGKELAQRYPDDKLLMGTLSTMAMDADRADEALAYAECAGDNPEGLATLGMLTLDKEDFATSSAIFERAIELQPTNARAWVGKGLSMLASGQTKEAVEALDHGATLFDDHLGSWIAAGWAHVVGGNYESARSRFEHTLALDDTFAESHGALAVLDLFEGRVEDARRRCDIALRLDKKSLGGALAKVLILQQDGDPEKAARVRDLALSMPIGPNGKTIAQMLVKFGSGARH